jgi:hypothetical protein
VDEDERGYLLRHDIDIRNYLAQMVVMILMTKQNYGVEMIEATRITEAALE